jgi:hypothetical protein
MLHKSFRATFDVAWVLSQNYPSQIVHSLQVGMVGAPREPWEDGPGRVCWELPKKPTEVGPGRVYFMGAFREPHEVGPDRG